jgi:hypothetical protein
MIATAFSAPIRSIVLIAFVLRVSRT